MCSDGNWRGKDKLTMAITRFLVFFKKVELTRTSAMDGSKFCDKNVQISSLYCFLTVFYSFPSQLLTSLIKNKKHTCSFV